MCLSREDLKSWKGGSDRVDKVAYSKWMVMQYRTVDGHLAAVVVEVATGCPFAFRSRNCAALHERLVSVPNSVGDLAWEQGFVQWDRAK